MSSISIHLRAVAFCALVSLASPPAYASTVSSQDFGSSPIGVPVNLSVAIPPVTPGPASLSLRYALDFSLGGCTQNSAGCTAALTFDPTKPGLRQDALIVQDANGAVVEEIFLHGIGTGAQPVFSPATATLQYCGGTACGLPNYGYHGIAAEANGRILLPNSAGNSILEFDPRTGNATTIPGVPATTSPFPVVSRLAVDAAGNIFYGYYDYNNQSAAGIHRIDAVTGADAVAIAGIDVGDAFIARTGTVYYVSGDQVFAADPNSYAVTLIAGNGIHGYGGDGGPATDAELASPSGIVLDNSGNVYVADSSNQRIRKIDRTGTITTIAGIGAVGNSGDGGLATNAGLASPSALATDAAGDLYVSAGAAIRRIDAGTGFISTIAGGGSSGDVFVGLGSSASAQMVSGGVLTIDPDGNLWSITSALYEISTSAYAIRFPFAVAGQGSAQTISILNAGTANLSQPLISVSGEDTADFSAASTCGAEITPGTACSITISFTAGSDATPQASINLADNASQSSQAIPVSGSSGAVAPATAQLSAVEVGASSAAPQLVNGQFAGNAVGLTASLAYGNEFSLGQLSCSGAGTISCNIPVTFTPLYPGLRQDAIRFLDASGNVIYQCFLNATGLGPQWFIDPAQIGSMTLPASTQLSSIDAAGNLYAVLSAVGTPDSGLVYRFNKDSGQWAIVAGQSNSGYNTGDGGPATSATFEYVNSAVADAAGNLYVGETFAIRRVDAHTGIVTTGAQQGGSLFTIDSLGHLFFVDSSDFRVNRFDPSTGVITTYAGNGQYGTPTGDGGPATAATLGSVMSLGFDGVGNLLISAGFSIRKVDANSGIITTYSKSCGYSNISLDAAGDLFLSCGGMAIVPPGGGTPQFIETTTFDDIYGPMLRDASGTFYTSDGRILGPGLPTPYNLPSATVGSSSQETIQLTNSGNQPLPIYGVALNGANAAQFSENNTCGQSLSPAQNCALNLTFTPVQAGSATAALTVSSTLPPLQSTISSAGLVGVLQLSPNSLNFGTQPSSSTTVLSLLVFNYSSVPVTISGVSISGPNASDFTEASNCLTVLTASQYCSVYVTFQAGALGARTASLSITDNAAGSPQIIPISAVSSAAQAPNVGYVAYWGVNNTGVTVSWSTDLPATTQLAYGTTTALGQLSKLQTTLANSHGVVLTNLSPGTTYYFVAQSATNGVTGYSATYSFTTSGTATQAVPVISGVTAANVTGTSATITWTTDQAASSQVNYGTTTSYGSSSTLDPTLVTSHSVTLSGLTAGVTYNFDVVSVSATNLSATSSNSTFTTTVNAAPSGTAPYVGYVAYWGVNNTGATISWSTDLPATTQLGYGTTTALGQLSPLQTTLANSHGVTLTTLNPATTYYFVAQSTAADGVTGYSTTYSFTTSGTATQPAPIISGVIATNITSTSSTITWTTDQATSSQVNYGATTSYGFSSTLDPTLVTSHSVTLSGLTAGITYNFDVVSVSATNLSATSSNSTFTTTAAPTGTAPYVGYVAFWGVNNIGATISWSTDLPANTQLAYGTTAALGQLSPLQTTLANNHGVTLTSLNPGTTYYFVAQSTAADGVTGYSTTYSFTTSGTATQPAPIISGVTAANITNTSATITWTTDQATSSQVNYGTTTSYGSSSTLDPTLVTSHSVTLSGLTAGAAYNFDVASVSAANLSATSSNSTFATTTTSVPTAAAPYVGYVAYWGVNNTGVTISWSTNLPATTQLAYGTTTALGQISPLQTTLSNNHGVILTNLYPGTAYFFVAQSTAASGVTGYSTTYSFTTSGTASQAAEH